MRLLHGELGEVCWVGSAEGNRQLSLFLSSLSLHASPRTRKKGRGYIQAESPAMQHQIAQRVYLEFR